ncbi:MAG: 6-carboxytetrahydropterin synthase QueD [Syntrophobacterales bacterium]|nr:6-carboxytetrahydropterin synthase QueD [Syntrophobacterales bacterium]
MYEVTVRKSFSAAHKLNIGGKCEELHGHNFTVDVTIASDNLNKEGLVVDFRILKDWTNEILDEFDHKFLNEIPFLKGTSPTSENIARFIFDKIAKKATAEKLRISQVTVWESNNACATYRGENNG